MNVNPDTGEYITLEEAQQYVKAYRQLHPEGIVSFTVGSNRAQAILEQKGCIGIRIYHGFDEREQQYNLVLIGVDEDGEDMREGVIVDRTQVCPPNCHHTLLDN